MRGRDWIRLNSRKWLCHVPATVGRPGVRGIALGLGLIALIASSAVAAEIARIKTASGTAAIVRGTQKLKPAPGLQLEAHDTLVTGKDGRMAVTFIDNTRFAIGPNS